MIFHWISDRNGSTVVVAALAVVMLAVAVCVMAEKQIRLRQGNGGECGGVTNAATRKHGGATSRQTAATTMADVTVVSTAAVAMADTANFP